MRNTILILIILGAFCIGAAIDEPDEGFYDVVTSPCINQHGHNVCLLLPEEDL